MRGAFTGADRDRQGLFEAASGGTLFLDEIGETSPGLQAKLLRALQEKKVRPVGASRARDADVRVIAATNRELDAMRKEGLFRDDLYYRLGAVALTLPPLRDRGEDIFEIAERVLADEARRAGVSRLHLDPGAAEALRAHSWPGNVRELEHVLRAASLFAVSGRIGREALAAAGLGGGAGAAPDVPRSGEGAAAGTSGMVTRTHAELREELDRREREVLRAALAAAEGNKKKAAAAVGLNRHAFARLLNRLGLE